MCPYCGDTMEYSKEQIKRFGKPVCCDKDMLLVDKNNPHMLIKGLNKIIETLEQEMIKGI